MKTKDLSFSFMRTIWQTVALIVLTAIIFIFYIISQKKFDDANELRLKSFYIADELRESSDDLTRMVRTFVITGNPLYKQHYQEILDIRNGLKPRPINYEHIYWDIIHLNDRHYHPLSKQKIPLLKMMQEIGLTKEEFSKLAEAKKNSDKLTKIEYSAMQLVEERNTNKEANREKAINLLYNVSYYQAKAIIMKPLSEFQTLIKKRMDNAVHKAKTISLYLLIFLAIDGLILLSLLWKLYKELESILGGSVDDVYAHITRIGNGDFLSPMAVMPNRENSILGWLNKTQINLDKLTNKNERLRKLYAALSQCNQAIVRSKNQDELFEIICRDAINFGGMKMAWVGMLDEKDKLIKPVVFFGKGTDYLENLTISTDPTNPASQGPSGQAFLKNKPFWCQDFAQDPSTALWIERAKKYEWGSSASLPLQRNNKVVGVFNVYAKEINAFDEEEQNLLIEMALDISYALDGFEREAKRINTESKLAKSYNLLTTIINTAPIRIFWKDKNLNYLGCNLAFAKDAGENNINALIGKNDTQLRWKDNAELYRVSDLKVTETGVAQLFYEEQESTYNGRDIWLSKSKVPLYDKNSEIIGILGVYEDITARKEMEITLQKEKDAAQNYLDIISVMILILDSNNNVILINRRGCEIIGYEADEVIGKNWIDNFLPQRFRNKVNEVSDSLIKAKQKKIEYFENPILTKDGKEKMIAWNNTLMYDASGNVIGLLTSGEDITERRIIEERNIYLANYDLLTGLPNRAYLDNQLKYILGMAKRKRENIAIMLLDLDHFKDINDTLGHDIGDLLLIEYAKRLQSSLREIDTVSRLGGDEFIILLPNIRMSSVGKLAQKLIDVIKRPFEIDGQELHITTSIGIAIYPDDGVDFKTLYKNIDTAMYRAKKEGRNSYRFFTEKMQQHSVRNLQLSNAMAHAIDRDEFELFFQPQIALKDEKIIGAEALLRWNYGGYGIISPAEFIPIAENNGLILPIGEWVLRSAAKQAKKWIDEEMDPIIIAVNISAVQFRHLSLPETVSKILEEVGLPPFYLELELTESVAMHNPQKAISTMNDLHHRGVRMSIDDFGTGYSSLNYLKKFKIYKLKIDQSFVRDVNTDEEDKAIVSTIINMSKSLGLKTIAEGVETIEQLEYLKEQGCDEIQGYYYSKPLPVKDFEAFVKDFKK